MKNFIVDAVSSAIFFTSFISLNNRIVIIRKSLHDKSIDRNIFIMLENFFLLIIFLSIHDIIPIISDEVIDSNGNMMNIDNFFKIVLEN